MSTVDIRKEFKTEAEAQSAREQILYNFHPAGYGTSLRVYQQPNDGLWVVDGYRYSSCD